MKYLCSCLLALGAFVHPFQWHLVHLVIAAYAQWFCASIPMFVHGSNVCGLSLRSKTNSFQLSGPSRHAGAKSCAIFDVPTCLLVSASFSAVMWQRAEPLGISTPAGPLPYELQVLILIRIEQLQPGSQQCMQWDAVAK